jgi:hypothetical protein
LKEVLRYIFGAVCGRMVCGGEGITMNLHELYNEPDIVKYIKVNGLGCAGHVMCMDNNMIVKKMFGIRPKGTRKIGRPKLRWEDGVTQDIKALGLKNWKSLTLNWEGWQKFLKKARAHIGLSWQ